jgi:hypothetical protein
VLGGDAKPKPNPILRIHGQQGVSTLPPLYARAPASAHGITAASASRCLRSAVSGIGQPIEIASQAVQPRLGGSRRHSFCCPAGLGGFLAIVSRRQRRRLLELVHEPQHNRPPRRCEFRGGSRLMLRDQSSLGTRSARWETGAPGPSRLHHRIGGYVRSKRI